MASSSASAPIESEVGRIRELSKVGRHHEALSAAESLALAAPQSRDVLYLIAANLRCLNRIPEALATLQRLEQHHPRFSLLYQERGHCHVILRDVPRGVEAFLRGVHLNPALATSWIMLEHLYRTMGDVENASKAAEHVSTLQKLPPQVVRAAMLFSDGDLSAAENILKTYLQTTGEHVEALRLLASLERERGVLHEAERLLESALKLAPNYRATRLDYVRMLIDRQKYPQADEVIHAMLSSEPGSTDCLSLYAAVCVGLGRYEPAIVLYRRLLAASPASAELHVALGHALRSVGRQEEAIKSYKTAAAIRPSFGDSYWSLANLKSYRFSDDEIAYMRREEATAATGPIDRYHLCFALGKAYEDRSDYAESWQYYERGNRLRRAENRYDPQVTESSAREQMEVCTRQFFSARIGVGAPNPDPIFIVGLPRSGSTLIEQILASHSQIEGTHELYDIQRMALDMQKHGSGADNPGYPSILAELPPEDFRRLGERYITDTRAYRTDRPFFIDKMPNNFRHLGLIHLMLPNATIIDVRREPMACCFSNLKQLFASGQEFTYSMEDMARYYWSYLDLMQHWDDVLPGRVLRVWYEEVVEDLETNVRRILEFCGFEFQMACLDFYRTKRSIRTPSSEQVRQPIFREGLFSWRNYEPWLRPLQDALGDALVRYRQ